MTLKEILEFFCRKLSEEVNVVLPVKDAPINPLEMEGIWWREIHCRVNDKDVMAAIQVIVKDARDRNPTQFYRLPLTPLWSFEQQRAETQTIAVRITLARQYPESLYVLDYMAR